MSGPLLQVRDLRRSFRRRRSLFGPPEAVKAVDGVSFDLAAGETLGLVGESGSGKSTLGRLVLRLIEPDSGRVTLDGQEVTGLSRGRLRALRREMQMVFQDPYGSLDPRMSASAIICEPLLIHAVPRSEWRGRLTAAMTKVGLDPAHADRYPHQFSGGQRQRIGIARAMTLSPRLLVLDEPVSALDVSIQAQVVNLLRALQRAEDLAFLFIAHDLAVVRHISHRVAVMYLGRIIEIGVRDALYAAPLHPYTVTLLSAVSVPDPVLERTRMRVMPRGEVGSAANLPSGCRFHPRCYRARQIARRAGADTVERLGEALPRACVERDPQLDPRGPGHAVACHHPELPEERSAEARQLLAAVPEPA